MASSRKRSSSSGAAGDLASGVAAQLAGLVKPGDHLVAAVSGGVDSVVLLDVLKRLSTRLRVRLSALHVNHQLSANAARWSAFCARICRDRGIPFRSVKVKVRRRGGGGLEAAARAARYEEFARQRCDFVVLAHHQDDQVETLLLQLLRGAGIQGLAAMPLVRNLQGGRGPAERTGATGHPSSVIPHPSLLRPLLEVTRERILAYARRRRLIWIEDETNADRQFQRNFLRHEVLPLIGQRFPAYRTTIARAARHLAETNRVLAEVAAEDGGRRADDGTLAVAAVARLPPGRALNLLRHFLAGHGMRMPNAARLDEALRQALRATRDAQVRIDLGAAELRRFEGRLHVVPKLTVRERPAARYHRLPQDRKTLSKKGTSDVVRRWRGEHRLELPELGGALVMAPCRGQGVSLTRLRGRPVTIRLRKGGERLQPDARRPRRTLKNLLQEARVPPWTRERLPLVFCGQDLIWAPAIGVDCRYRAAPRDRAIRPEWRPRPV